jgi:3-(methylthio)propanoyl-CoA dehydrogenase
MSEYRPPIQEMRFLLDEIAGLPELSRLPAFAHAEPELVAAVLEQASKLASEVLAPLNQSGDREGSVLENGIVRTPKGFREAYGQFVAGGWSGAAADTENGGQGLPRVLATVLTEMWNAANMSFGLCPLLSQGAIEALERHASAEVKAKYLAPLVAGRWTGTMNLTEPQAGTDLGSIRTRAVREGDHYRITGQKIFITWGDHDVAENIVHLVLARTPDAPAGVKGISLFAVPKTRVGPDGALGSRNDLRCVSLEHKLGIHASPTAVMAYGDDGGAHGELVGEENRGLEYMFTMMNNERLGVGVQGVAIADRAYQQALAFAKTRLQGRELGGAGSGPVAILRHADVRRMLLGMKARTEAARALVYYSAGQADRARHGESEAARRRAQAFLDLLTPVAKAWASEIGIEVASEGIQVHGGMGYVEETGAAQYYRDARIAAIYEGTNGIQANDLVFRKLLRDRGQVFREFLIEMRALAAAMDRRVRAALDPAIAGLERAGDWLVRAREPGEAAAGSVPFLRSFGIVVGAVLLARCAQAAERRQHESEAAGKFAAAKAGSARFFLEVVLLEAQAQMSAVPAAGAAVLEMTEEMF